MFLWRGAKTIEKKYGLDLSHAEDLLDEVRKNFLKKPVYSIIYIILFSFILFLVQSIFPVVKVGDSIVGSLLYIAVASFILYILFCCFDSIGVFRWLDKNNSDFIKKK